MATSKEEIVKTIAPEVLERWEERGREKGIEEGIEKGEMGKSQEAILRFLKARFGKVGDGLVEKVKRIQEINILDSLIDLAATCESLEDFEGGCEGEL